MAMSGINYSMNPHSGGSNGKSKHIGTQRQRNTVSHSQSRDEIRDGVRFITQGESTTFTIDAAVNELRKANIPESDLKEFAQVLRDMNLSRGLDANAVIYEDDLIGLMSTPFEKNVEFADIFRAWQCFVSDGGANISLGRLGAIADNLGEVTTQQDHLRMLIDGGVCDPSRADKGMDFKGFCNILGYTPTPDDERMAASYLNSVKSRRH